MCIRARTSAPVDPQDLPALLTAMTDTPERFAVAHDNAAGVRRALAALPAGQARAVAMAGIYGMTARQVSEAEGVPLGDGEDPYQGRNGEAALGLPPGGRRR